MDLFETAPTARVYAGIGSINRFTINIVFPKTMETVLGERVSVSGVFSDQLTITAAVNNKGRRGETYAVLYEKNGTPRITLPAKVYLPVEGPTHSIQVGFILVKDGGFQKIVMDRVSAENLEPRERRVPIQSPKIVPVTIAPPVEEAIGEVERLRAAVRRVQALGLHQLSEDVVTLLRLCPKYGVRLSTKEGRLIATIQQEFT